MYLNLMKTKLILAITSIAVAPVVTESAKNDPRVEVRGSIGLRLPNGAVSISVGNSRYHYHRGTYYKKGTRGYVVATPPRGAVIRELPRGHTRIVVAGTVYYRYRGAYYRREPHGFIVVEAPIVAQEKTITPIIEADPLSDYESVWMDGRELLFRDGQFFEKTPEGIVWIEAPIGAITPEIPSDAVSVWYEEIEYFDSDGVYFRKTPEGYRVVAAPWGEGA